MISKAVRKMKAKKGNQLFEIGSQHHEAFRQTGDAASLETAIQKLQQALDMTPPDDRPTLAARLLSTGYAYGDQYQITTALVDLEKSIQLVEKSVEAHSDDQVAARYQYLGLQYYIKSQVTGTLLDLDISLQRFKQAIDSTPDDHPRRTYHIVSLALKYQGKYQRTKDEADVNESIRHFEKALQSTPGESPDRSRLLESLAIIWRDKYQRTKAMSDLEKGIEYCQEALHTIPDGHHSKAKIYQSIGTLFRDKYRGLGSMIDLNLAIFWSEKAVEDTTENHTTFPQKLELLASGYNDRYLKTGSLPDLQKSIDLIQESLRLTPEGHPDRARQLQSCGLTYHARFQIVGEVSDLDKALQYCRNALDATPKLHLERPHRLEALAGIYIESYQNTGSSSKLNSSIQLFQEALEATPKDHLDQPQILRALGLAYNIKYQRTGQVSDLDLAMGKIREAFGITADNSPERVAQFHALGTMYHNRYLVTGALIDLETGIQYIETSLSLTSDKDSVQANLSKCLGTGYYNKYQRTKSTSDLNKAIQIIQKALSRIPKEHPKYPSYLRILGMSYHRRFESSKSTSDLETAIQKFQEALDATPDWDSTRRADRLESLGIAYHTMYQAKGSIIDLDTALQLYEDVLLATPENHAKRGARLESIGAGYWHRYLQQGATLDMSTALKRLSEALIESSSPPIYRLQAGRKLVDIHVKNKDFSSAYEAAALTLSLIPLLTSRSLENSDKQDILVDLAGLASDAAAIALMAGKTAYDAIGLLELGRGVITSSANDLRTDISKVQEVNPDLASDFMRFRNELDSPSTMDSLMDPPSIHPGSTLPVDRRYSAGRKLEEIIRAIRILPGFGRFLMAPSEDDLKILSASGPIIIINVSHYRCDALVIKDETFAFPLPGLRKSEVITRSTALSKAELVNTELLEWLWDTVAGPTLDHLGFVPARHDDWPRVWWILTGALAKFPIHAAGYHSRKLSLTVLDRVISSYSISLQALLQNYRNRLAHGGTNQTGKAVLVGMEKTPGQKRLPHVPREIHQLESLLNSAQFEIMKPHPFRNEVLTALGHCDIFHFAGHGHANSSEPLKSALLLDGEELAVASIFEMNLQSRMPFLAYLSACGTGQVNRDDLIDEGLHLISACQIAGFRHVLGTLWEVNDASCVEIMITTYEWMKKQNFSNESVSSGLHHACRKLRANWMFDTTFRASRTVPSDSQVLPVLEQVQIGHREVRASRTGDACDDEPLYWVPYVHFGS